MKPTTTRLPRFLTRWINVNLIKALLLSLLEKKTKKMRRKEKTLETESSEPLVDASSQHATRNLVVCRYVLGEKRDLEYRYMYFTCLWEPYFYLRR